MCVNLPLVCICMLYTRHWKFLMCLCSLHMFWIKKHFVINLGSGILKGHITVLTAANSISVTADNQNSTIPVVWQELPNMALCQPKYFHKNFWPWGSKDRLGQGSQDYYKLKTLPKENVWAQTHHTRIVCLGLNHWFNLIVRSYNRWNFLWQNTFFRRWICDYAYENCIFSVRYVIIHVKPVFSVWDMRKYVESNNLKCGIDIIH